MASSSSSPSTEHAQTSGHDYTMSRVKIRFPYKAYPSQVAMMNNIIKALQRSQNALLESPTGSGKSLALLCASLAWQAEEQRKAREYNLAVEQGIIEPEIVHVEDGDHSNDDEGDGEIIMCEDDVARLKSSAGFLPDNALDLSDFIDDESPGGQTRSDRAVRVGSAPKQPSKKLKAKKVKRKVVPKIFFGTRTHRQIAQIIRELNKTAYKDVRMTILGSRDHTCIHPTVSKMKNRNEGCKDLNDRKKGGGCPHMSNVKSRLSSHASVTSLRGSNDAWNLEDLVKVGKKVRACPYYASRELMARAQIVFCPYNYLVEPMIRKGMDINLKGQVLILDEAHNIEDSARAAASWKITQDEVKDAKLDLEKISELDVLPESHRLLSNMCSKLMTLIDSFSNELNDYSDFGSSSKVWTGTEILAVFKLHGLGVDDFEDLQSHFNKVVAEWQNIKESDDGMSDGVGLHSNTLNVLEGFLLVLGYLYMEGMKHKDDYRVALIRTQERRPASEKSGFGTWLGKQNAKGQEGFKLTYTLHFWCLNPAVAFIELKRSLRNIILTSGTLSPMVSFSSELDLKFSLQLEASHVIDKRQVWIGTVSNGPTGQSLNAVYRNAETFGFQDEVGRVTLGVCRSIPHGVLLFLPSYSMLNKLSDRWRQTGLWDDLCQHKVAILEPRVSEEFESSIRHFNDVIEATNDSKIAKEGGVTGALFVAVCRGKVSEGLDFADNHARAVICVGIPFPNVKDIQVDLKRKYNDRRKAQERTILSGSEWYEIQAFRALNQALGRCIRHRQDWGAIIMVDDRYQRVNRYITGLSKWVRSGVSHYASYHAMIKSLSSFSNEMESLQLQNVTLEERKTSHIPTVKVPEDITQVNDPLTDVTNVRAHEVNKVELMNTSESEGARSHFQTAFPDGENDTSRALVGNLVQPVLAKAFNFATCVSDSRESVNSTPSSSEDAPTSSLIKCSPPQVTDDNEASLKRKRKHSPVMKKAKIVYVDSDDDFVQ